MNRYTFDVQMFAAVTVEAESREAAVALINERIDGASCNAGAWPNGDPILFEASLESLDLIEVTP